MMPEFPEIDRRLEALRDAAQGWNPPLTLDEALAARVAAAATRPPRAREPRHWIAWPLALAATLAIVSFAVRALLADPGDPPQAAVRSATGERFNLVVPLAELERVDDARVVPARVPRLTLAQWGVPVDPARAAEPVDAQLLVRRDGALLAWRVVP